MLQSSIIKTTKCIGNILCSKEQKGKVFIDGVFFKNYAYLNYGYNIESIVIDKTKELDGEYLLRCTSKLWRYSNRLEDVKELRKRGVSDVKYVDTVNYGVLTYKDYELEKDIDMYLNGEEEV